VSSLWQFSPPTRLTPSIVISSFASGCVAATQKNRTVIAGPSTWAVISIEDWPARPIIAPRNVSPATWLRNRATSRT
jgi:hypothetical protein